MNSFKRFFSLLFISVLVLNNFTYVNAISKDVKAKKAYEIYMQKYPDGYNGYYKIADIDKNGIPELLCHADNKYILCTYNDKTKKVIVLKNISAAKDNDSFFRYNISKKQVYFSVVTTKTSEDIFVKVNGKKAPIAKRFEIKWNGGAAGTNIYTHYVNGKKVSENVYKKKLDKALKGFKTVR